VNPITQALRAGHSAQKILEYLSGTNAGLASKIASALGMGYSAKAVLDFVFKAGKSVSNVLQNPSKEETSLYKRADYIEPGLKRSLMTGGALLGGLGALGARGATALGPEIEVLGPEIEGLGGSMLSAGDTTPPLPGAPVNPAAGMPQSPGQMATPQTPMLGPQIGQQIAQGVQQPVQQAMQPATQAEMGQAAQAMPQPGQQLPSVFEELTKNVDVKSLSPEKVKQLQFVKTISDKLEQEGKPITDPAFQGVAKKIKSILQGKPGTVIEETARIAGTQPQQPIVQPQEPKITSVDAPPIAKPLSKGSEVITTTGDIAIIDDLPGKTAKVDVDGTKQVHATDDLIPIPDNSEEIGDIYQKLIDKTPEGHKSRVYDAIGYDPQRNAIKYTYHDGKSYIIDDVPEEIAKEIANSGYLAKTSGGNYMGFYYKGNPSIGAGMSVLINDLQKLRGGKGKEYSYKFEELYSQHRLPKNILKERSEKEKLRAREEKAKKKRSAPRS